MDIRFTDISTTITRLRSGDVLAVDNLGPGSAQILAEDASGGAADWGVFVFNNASTTLWTIPFSYTLPSAPTSYRLTFMAPSGNTIVVYGNALIGSSLTQFQIQLQGPTGDLVHSARWEAFL